MRGPPRSVKRPGSVGKRATNSSCGIFRRLSKPSLAGRRNVPSRFFFDRRPTQTTCGSASVSSRFAHVVPLGHRPILSSCRPGHLGHLAGFMRARMSWSTLSADSPRTPIDSSGGVVGDAVDVPDGLLDRIEPADVEEEARVSRFEVAESSHPVTSQVDHADGLWQPLHPSQPAGVRRRQTSPRQDTLTTAGARKQQRTEHHKGVPERHDRANRIRLQHRYSVDRYVTRRPNHPGQVSRALFTPRRPMTADGRYRSAAASD